MMNIYLEKCSGTRLLTASNPKNKPKRFLYNMKSPFHLAPHTQQENVKGKSFFSQKPDRNNSIMVTTNNNSNVICTMDRQGVSNRDMIGITTSQQTFFNMDLNPEKPIQWESRKVHPLIKRLFLSISISDTPLAGRLKHFVGSWMKITQDPKILDIVKGYKIPFHSKPFQSKIPFHPIVSREGEELVKLEVKEMLKKGAIRKVQPSKGEFVSNLFLVKKKDGGQRPVINLKQLNAYIPYCHFKMKGLQNLKYILQKGDYMCKLNLKDAHFSVPLEKNSRQFVRFR